MDDKRLLKVSEAAAICGFSRSFFYGLVMEGKIASIKIGRTRRIPTQAIDQFIALQLDAASGTLSEEAGTGRGGGGHDRD